MKTVLNKLFIICLSSSIRDAVPQKNMAKINFEEMKEIIIKNTPSSRSALVDEHEHRCSMAQDECEHMSLHTIQLKKISKHKWNFIEAIFTNFEVTKPKMNAYSDIQKTFNRKRQRTMHMKRMTGFTEEDLEDFHQIFEFFDKDCTRTMDLGDLEVALCALGYNPTVDEIELLTETMVIDNDRSIDFSEFCMIVEFICDLKEQEGLLRGAFRCIDQDHDGLVNSNDLLDLLKEDNNMSPKEANELIRYADANGDGKIVYEDFIQMLCDIPDTNSDLSHSPSAASFKPSSSKKSGFSEKAKMNWQSIKFNRNFIANKFRNKKILKPNENSSELSSLRPRSVVSSKSRNSYEGIDGKFTLRTEEQVKSPNETRT